MKKYLILVFIFLIACSNEVEEVKEVVYGGQYYRVATPYQPPVANNYVLNNDVGNYYPRQVEEDLMLFSTNFFKTNNSLYQAGQFLTEEKLEKLLASNYLNFSEKMVINDEEYETNFIIAILEQNFLALNGNLKGISLGVVINQYQPYQNERGAILHQEIEVPKEFIVQTANDLVEYIREFPELEEKRIMVSFFYLNSPSAQFPGSIKYLGDTFTDEINLEEIDYQYHLLSSNYVLSNDLETYNLYRNLKEEILKINNSRITGEGIYFNHQLKELNMTIENVFYHKSEIIKIANVIEEIINNSRCNCYVNIQIKQNQKLEALITKEETEILTDVIILRR